MIIIRKITFVICGALILMSSKCQQTKVIAKANSEVDTFEIFNGFTQKMIPGERSKNPYIEFGFEIKGMIGKTILDSVFCEVGQSLAIKSDGEYRIKLVVKDQLKYDKAVFFYTKNDSKYSYILNSIKLKEEVFLP